ncbi:MAG: hypothetical protein WC943_01210, partial [Elusimicrobiota bacterium]
AGALGVEVSVSGIPECVLADAEVPNEESRAVFDEVLEPGGEPASLPRLRRETLKAKIPACRKCRNSGLCEGVWKGYLRLNGGAEFHAL